MLYAIFGVLVIILDQWVKYWAAGNLVYGGEARPLIPGIINLLNVHNDGAAFSFLSGANAGKIFVVLAAVFTVLVIVGLATNFISGRLARWCAVFVAAGGIGNAIDRALYDYVQDMFQFAFAPSFPVFNVADVFIVVFCLLFILCILLGGRREKQIEPEEDYDLEEEEEIPAPRRSRSAERSRAMEEEVDAPVSRRARTPAREEEPEDTEEEEVPPRFRNRAETVSHARTSRKERQSRYEDQFEQYKANRDARQRSAEYSGVSSSDPAFASSVPTYDSSDPFAEWEKANAAISSRKAAQEKAPAAAVNPRTPAAEAPARPVRQAAPAAPAPAPAPAAVPERPVEKKASAPQAAQTVKSSDEFSLDDILAEFR